MSKSLGIFVTNPDQFKHVMGITKAAKAKLFDAKVAKENARNNRVDEALEAVAVPDINSTRDAVSNLQTRQEFEPEPERMSSEEIYTIKL